MNELETLAKLLRVEKTESNESQRSQLEVYRILLDIGKSGDLKRIGEADAVLDIYNKEIGSPPRTSIDGIWIYQQTLHIKEKGEEAIVRVERDYNACLDGLNAEEATK